MIPEHGHSKYVNDQCRCAVCRGANADYHFNRRAQREAFVQKNGLPRSVTHGLSAYINWGCRCSVCTAARREDNRRRKASPA